MLRCDSYGEIAETALVVVIPELEPLVGETYRRHIPAGSRGMPPHITLLAPFASTADVAERAGEVALTLGSFAPFTVAFRETAQFDSVLYLVPEPAEPFVVMTEALARAFPEHPPYGGEFDEIIPHATVAMGEPEVLARISEELQPIDVVAQVERVWLFEHARSGWRRHTAFPLG